MRIPLALILVLTLTGCGKTDSTPPVPAGAPAPTAKVAPDPVPVPPAPVAKPGACAPVTIQVNKDGVVVHRDKDIAAKLDALEPVLKQLASECRGDVTVVPSDDAVYQDLIRTMDVSVKNGLIEVSLADSADDAAKPAPPPTAAGSAKPAIDFKTTVKPDGSIELKAGKMPPLPNTREALKDAPIVIVSKTAITIHGTEIALDDAIAKHVTDVRSRR